MLYLLLGDLKEIVQFDCNACRVSLCFFFLSKDVYTWPNYCARTVPCTYSTGNHYFYWLTHKSLEITFFLDIRQPRQNMWSYEDCIISLVEFLYNCF